jgi:TPR repeat protein
MFTRTFVFFLLLFLTFASSADNLVTGLQAYELEDYGRSMQHLSVAAEQGEAVAQHHLGLMYASGLGVKKSNKKAHSWFTKAASQNYIESKFELGKLFSTGRRKAAAYVVAEEWFRKAANEGHSGAKYHLGNLYVEGKGVEKNMDLAIDWYRKAANAGHLDAQLKMATNTADPAEKVLWYTKAANQGDDRAQKSLGDIYFDGRLINKNYPLALDWYTKAANSDNESAYLQLGKLYESATSDIRNEETAIFWYRKAAAADISIANFHAETLLRKRCMMTAQAKLFDLYIRCVKRDEFARKISDNGGTVNFSDSHENLDVYQNVKILGTIGMLELLYSENNALLKAKYTVNGTTETKQMTRIYQELSQNYGDSNRSRSDINAFYWVLDDGVEIEVYETSAQGDIALLYIVSKA